MTLWRRRRRDEDFRDEIDAHLALEADRLIADGMAPDQARLAAQRIFGNTTRAQERFYESRRILWVDALLRDARYAVRGIHRNPGFAAVAILTLALGIGANAAIFSVVHAVLRPLPYEGADRIVRIYEDAPGAPDGGMRPLGFTKVELDILRRSSWTVSHAGIYLPSTMTLSGRGEAVRLTGVQISPALMAMLGVRPALGRIFGPHEDAPMDRVVILSDQGWRRRFAADASVVGRVVQLDGNPYTVIGVMPRGFRFPDPETEYWIPFVFPPGARLVVTARVKAGIAKEAAAREIGAILGRVRSGSAFPAPPPPPPPPPPRADGRPRTLEEVLAMSPPMVRPEKPGQAPRPKSSEPLRIRLLGFHDFLVGSHRRALLMLAAAVGFVLLIACANVANLLLARGAARQREFVVRLAIGASRARLVRQLLTESTLLASAGGLVGTALAIGAVQVFRGMGTTLPRAALGPGFGIPRLDEVVIDSYVLIFTALIAVIAGIVAGVIPALRHSTTVAQLDGQLRSPISSSDSGWRWSRGFRARPLLIVFEVALATVLFVSAGLLIRSFVKLAAVHPGYEAAGLLTFQVVAPPTRAVHDWRNELRDRIASAPGVDTVAFADQLPMSGRRGSVYLRKTPEAGGPPPPPSPGGGGPPQFPSLRIVSPDFTTVMRTRIVEGRGLLDADVAGSPRAMLINQTVARSGYLGPHPVGTEIYAVGSMPWRIVGIVEDMRQTGLDQEPGPEVFISDRQFPMPAGRSTMSLFFVVRTAVTPASVVPDIRAVIARYDSQFGLDRVATMEDIVSNTLVRPKFFTTLLGTFAAVALLLAVTGIYAVLSFMVRQRRREIGIRMSLGATRAGILKLMLREGGLLSTAGLMFGLAASVVVTRSLSSQLFGVTPLDAPTYFGVALSFGLVSALACYVPARRATRVDPVSALRDE